jgi:hypothetical protein
MTTRKNPSQRQTRSAARTQQSATPSGARAARVGAAPQTGQASAPQPSAQASGGGGAPPYSPPDPQAATAGGGSAGGADAPVVYATETFIVIAHGDDEQDVETVEAGDFEIEVDGQPVTIDDSWHYWYDPNTRMSVFTLPEGLQLSDLPVAPPPPSAPPPATY